MRRIASAKRGYLTETTVTKKNIPRYIELINHIDEVHPRKERKNKHGEDKQVPFGICDEIGDLCCCAKIGMVVEEDDPDKGRVSDAARELGIGPTLFLMNLKALAYLFAVLTILNIPVLCLFYYGNADKTASTFARLSLGNIGEPPLNCGNDCALKL